MLLFRRQDFETSARALIQACHQSSASTSSEFPFTNWQLTESSEHGGGSENMMYLTHPPVTQVVSQSEHLLALEQPQQQEDDNSLPAELLWQDDSILVDHDQNKGESNNNNNNNNPLDVVVQEVILIWNISVVYSETFQVPVLYFTLEYTNGCPVERRSMVSLLSLTMDNPMDMDQEWSSVSQDLHPETGRPSYFLHPCHTNDTLQHMMMISTATATATTTTKITCPSLLWMWTWMSIVLPVIGYGIPSKYFLEIQQRLTSTGEPSE